MDSSRADTQNSRFISQGSTAEDLLKTQTVDLVNLAEYKKRRAEAIEQKDREASAGYSRSGTATPNDGSSTPLPPSKKKKKKNPTKGKLSFAFDDEDISPGRGSKSTTPASHTPVTRPASPAGEENDESRVRLGPNASVTITPKVMTKATLLKEAQTREQLRKEFLVMQDAVKSTEFLLPFVFFDGSNIPGGVCRMKKGDRVWLFLDRSRKIGANRGVSGSGEKQGNVRREWARVSVDDLLFVRGDLIIPHHYDFYYFIVNKTLGTSSVPLFPYSDKPTDATPTNTELSMDPIEPDQYNPLSKPAEKKDQESGPVSVDEAKLEGRDADPSLTKVVDRRWYERHKHIFPANVWEEFDPTKDYSNALRKDGSGNTFFF